VPHAHDATAPGIKAAAGGTKEVNQCLMGSFAIDTANEKLDDPKRKETNMGSKKNKLFHVSTDFRCID
jgi:hypothetical protein